MENKHSGFNIMGIISGLRWTMNYFTPWSTTVVGTGNTWQGYFRMRAYTGATAASTASNYLTHYRKGIYSFSYTADFEIEFVFSHYGTSGANGKTYLKIDGNTGPNDPAVRAVGFRIDNNALKGIVHNGTSLTVVDLSTTLTSTPVRLKIKFRAGSKIEWYVDDVKKGESASIPSSSQSSYFVVATKNGADAADQKAVVGKIEFWQEW